MPLSARTLRVRTGREVEILREQLRRVGKIEYAGEIRSVTGPDFGYRNRVQLHLRNQQIGYLAAGSHDLVPIADCPIASPKLNEVIGQLRDRMREPKFPHFVHSMELFTNESEVQLNVLETDRPVAQWFYKSFNSVVGLDYPTDFGTFRVSPKSFFQVNRFLLNELVRAAVPDEGGKRALDLYAGVGLFAIPLAQRFEQVTSVESGSAATRDLEFNATRAGIALEGVNARVEDYLMNIKSRPDFVLADPPRAGTGENGGEPSKSSGSSAHHHCLVRPCNVSPRLGRAQGLSNYSDDNGGPVPQDLSFGNSRRTPALERVA